MLNFSLKWERRLIIRTFVAIYLGECQGVIFGYKARQLCLILEIDEDDNRKKDPSKPRMAAATSGKKGFVVLKPTAPNPLFTVTHGSVKCDACGQSHLRSSLCKAPLRVEVLYSQRICMKCQNRNTSISLLVYLSVARQANTSNKQLFMYLFVSYFEGERAYYT